MSASRRVADSSERHARWQWPRRLENCLRSSPSARRPTPPHLPPRTRAAAARAAARPPPGSAARTAWTRARVTSGAAVPASRTNRLISNRGAARGTACPTRRRTSIAVSTFRGVAFRLSSDTAAAGCTCCQRCYRCRRTCAHLARDCALSCPATSSSSTTRRRHQRSLSAASSECGLRSAGSHSGRLIIRGGVISSRG
jgi:hypothetical protein